MDPLSTPNIPCHYQPPVASGPGLVSAQSAVDHCLQQLCNQLLIGPDKASRAFSSASLVPVVGMMLAAMDDRSKKEVILGLPKGSLTPELEKEIHNLLGRTSRYIASGNQSAVTSANFLVSAPELENPVLNRVLRDSYSAETLVVNIGELANATNELIKQKTQGQINGVFENCKAIVNVELLLGNVLSFQGLWSEPFRTARTYPQSFHCADHQTIKNVLMMHSTEKVQHAQYGCFSAIAKNFKSDDDDQRLRFIAILPNDENLHTIDQLDHGTINVLLNLLDRSPLEFCRLCIPKIEIDSVDDQLLDKLHATLGMQFTPDVLSGLRLTPTSRLGILNTLKVSLSEEGVKGSVANVMFSSRGGHTVQYREFFFDRPGYFAIVDEYDRLVEAVVKDGKYLVTDGPKKWAATTACKHIPEKTVKTDCVEEKRDWKESVTGPQITTEHSKENLSTRDYQRLFNKQFNSDGVLKIKGFETDDNNFDIVVGSDDEIANLRNRVLKEIGRGLEKFVVEISHDCRDGHVFKVRIDFAGKDELFKLLKKKKSG